MFKRRPERKGATLLASAGMMSPARQAIRATATMAT